MGEKKLLDTNICTSLLSNKKALKMHATQTFYLFLLHLTPELALKTLNLSSEMDWLPI